MVVYVDSESSGPVHDGKTWDTAFFSLDVAEEAANQEKQQMKERGVTIQDDELWLDVLSTDETLASNTKHIKHTHADRKSLSWCGQTLSEFDWTFQDIDHATYSREQGQRLQPCPSCVEVVIKTLKGEA